MNLPTLLTIDDQPDLRKLVRLTVAGSVAQCLEASNAAEALALLQQHVVDVLIVDVMLPGELSGLQLVSLIRQMPLARQPPVIMVSARGQQADIEAGLAAGANHYLVKPFSPVTLLQLIRAL